MQAVIITNDSGVKLPKISKWHNKYGIGKDITKDCELISLLEMYNLNVPSDDFINEIDYSEILKDYIRPTIDMFAGPFNEVRSFLVSINKLVFTKLYVISGRYGLLNENNKIIPYTTSIKNIKSLKKLDYNTNFRNNMLNVCKNKDIIILLLPKHFITYLLNINWFDFFKNNQFIFIVSSKNLKSNFIENNYYYLERKGVTRIGNMNKEIILETIEKIMKEK